MRRGDSVPGIAPCWLGDYKAQFHTQHSVAIPSQSLLRNNLGRPATHNACWEETFSKRCRSIYLFKEMRITDYYMCTHGLIDLLMF